MESTAEEEVRWEVSSTLSSSWRRYVNCSLEFGTDRYGSSVLPFSPKKKSDYNKAPAHLDKAVLVEMADAECWMSACRAFRLSRRLRHRPVAHTGVSCTLNVLLGHQRKCMETWPQELMGGRHSTTAGPSQTTSVLRDYQNDCIEACLRELKAGVRKQAVSLPVGSGKTVLTHIMPPTPLSLSFTTDTNVLLSKRSSSPI
jgi:hypothetical protein